MQTSCEASRGSRDGKDDSLIGHSRYILSCSYSGLQSSVEVLVSSSLVDGLEILLGELLRGRFKELSSENTEMSGTQVINIAN